MKLTASVRSFVRSIVLRPRLEREMEQELRFHVDARVDDLVAAGLSRADAERRARREFGDPLRWKEEGREAHGLRLVDDFVSDIRYGARILRRNPGFAVVAVLSLAIGIGANTAIFSLVDTLLLRTLPVRDPQELIQIQASFEVAFLKLNRTTDAFSRGVFEYFRGRDQMFTETFAFYRLNRPDVSVDGDSGYSNGVELVSGNYFSALGVNAVVGRSLTPADDTVPGANPVAVISYGCWKRRFGLVPSVLGKTIRVNDIAFSVIGVMPPRFAGVSPEIAPDLWLPMMMQRQLEPATPLLDSHDWWLKIMARLKPGVSPPQARSAANVLFRQMESDLIARPGVRFAREPIELIPASRGYSMLRQQFSQPLLILTIAVGLVLLIACANVANLLLARATVRRHEIRTRLAVGAGRMRLVRQLLTESLLMASMAGLLGLIFASWGTQVLLNMLPRGPAPIAVEAHLDPRILAFTGMLSLFASVLFGLAPAFGAVRVDLGAGSARLGSDIRPGVPLVKLLVISQVALSLLLLVSTLLFVRSLQKLKNVDLGLDPRNLLQISIDTRGSGYKDERLAGVYGELLERISAIPGVRSVSGSSNGLIQGHWTRTSVSVPGYTPAQDEDETVDSIDVGPRFFETVGAPLWRGRDFSAADHAAAAKVVVINQSMARRYFGGQNPIGRRLGTGPENNAEFQIVGVVKDARLSDPRQQAPLMMYFSALQRRMDRVSALQVRTSGDAAATAAAVRREVHAVDKRLLVDVKTLADQVNDSLVQERLVGMLSGFFGLVALVLANVGLYGVMAYSVTRRTGEIGIRMALGAQRRDVLSLILRETMTLALIGLAIGVPAALIAARVAGHLISGLLYGLTPTDPVTLAMATGLMMGVAGIAGYLPARTACRMNPLRALRYE